MIDLLRSIKAMGDSEGRIDSISKEMIELINAAQNMMNETINNFILSILACFWSLDSTVT
jgi:hypothetical protein